MADTKQQHRVHNAYQAICETDSEARYEEHEAIFTAIKMRDAAAARQAMHHHFERILAKLISAEEARAFEALKSKTMASRETVFTRADEGAALNLGTHRSLLMRGNRKGVAPAAH